MRSFLSLKLLDITTIISFFQKKVIFFYNKRLTNNQYFLEIFSAGLYRFFFLMNFFFADKRLYFVDLFTIKPVAGYVDLFYIFSSFSSNYRFVLKKKHSNYFTNSLSGVWEGVCWPEREMSEFSGFFINKLYDSRRLLSDYAEVKGFVSTHLKSLNYYNSAYSDILL